MNSAEQIEQHLQRLKAERTLILDQVDNAIALFDRDRHLILFNQKLAQMWQLSPDWLRDQPHYDQVLNAIVEGGYWSAAQRQEFERGAASYAMESTSFPMVQADGVCVEVYATATSEGGWLFNFRDVTSQQQSRATLDAEVRRLTFLLGLTERLQTSVDLCEIGQFALSYLVQVMNAAFGDIKVIYGVGRARRAGTLTNEMSSQFIATYGIPAVAAMQDSLKQGIPYGQGLLWDVVESGEPMFVDDYSSHPKAVAAFRHPAVGQLGIFPIPAADGTIIGVVTLESRSFAQKLQEAPQQDMLLAACRTLGVAIERVQSQERLQRINADLERASRLKSEFLASMSHELRTPLNSILGFSDLLQRQAGGELTARQLSHVSAIARSGQHLLELINEILDLSKIEAGKADLEVQLVSIATLCQECLRMIQPRAEKKRLGLSLELDYRLDRVPLDERRVRQMVVNLLSNAVKFTPEMGHVKLAGKIAYGSQLTQDLRPDHSPVNLSTPYLCLEVIDTGIGIPEDKWSLLFQPFQQIDASLTRRHEGTGLGLALTKRLAELHGGTISFESRDGEGSTFRIWLPLTEMRQALTTAPASRQSQLNDRQSWQARTRTAADAQRILVVEDQPYNQVLISELLELEGFAVELIGDGHTMEQAIDSPWVTAKSLPDLILMDIQLPGVDGFELIRQIKAHVLWQQVPVVVVTAMAMRGDRDRCLAAGADAYLSKPLDLTALLAQVRSLLQAEPEKS